MPIPRLVEPEWLDSLPADDPRALRSRADLRRINHLMASRSTLGRGLECALADSPGPTRLVELGAGDGTLALALAQRLSRHRPVVCLTLLDLQPAVESSTLKEIAATGWQVDLVRADALEWMARLGAHSIEQPKPIVFANLFVHHFDGERLRALLDAIASCAQAFVCLEPRRSRIALTGSHLLGAIGCNDVTRHDAVTSVHAGFAARELSAFWPAASGWKLHEGAAGLFGHQFHAVRARR